MEKKWIENFGQNLKVLRKQKGYSQQRLAELSQLSVAIISKIERGALDNLTLQTIAWIGEALGQKDPLEMLTKT